MHSICQRALGFAWIFVATMFVAFGCLLGFLGLAGGLLVRVRPDTQQNINYDPSTIALMAPIPVVIGLILHLGFIRHARRLGHQAKLS
jgi:hypothetical protein